MFFRVPLHRRTTIKRAMLKEEGNEYIADALSKSVEISIRKYRSNRKSKNRRKNVGDAHAWGDKK